MLSCQIRAGTVQPEVDKCQAYWLYFALWKYFGQSSRHGAKQTLQYDVPHVLLWFMEVVEEQEILLSKPQQAQQLLQLQCGALFRHFSFCCWGLQIQFKGDVGLWRHCFGNTSILCLHWNVRPVMNMDPHASCFRPVFSISETCHLQKEEAQTSQLLHVPGSSEVEED